MLSAKPQAWESLLAETVEQPVGGADYQAAVCDRRGRCDALSQLQRLRLLAAVESNYVERAAGRAEIDAVADDHRRAIDATVGLKAPRHVSLEAMDGMHVAVA